MTKISKLRVLRLLAFLSLIFFMAALIVNVNTTLDEYYSSDSSFQIKIDKHIESIRSGSNKFSNEQI